MNSPTLRDCDGTLVIRHGGQKESELLSPLFCIPCGISDDESWMERCRLEGGSVTVFPLCEARWVLRGGILCREARTQATETAGWCLAPEAKRSACSLLATPGCSDGICHPTSRKSCSQADTVIATPLRSAGSTTPKQSVTQAEVRYQQSAFGLHRTPVYSPSGALQHILHASCMYHLCTKSQEYLGHLSLQLQASAWRNSRPAGGLFPLSSFHLEA